MDHLRAADEQMAGMLMAGRIVMHPFVFGEISLGSLQERATKLRQFKLLPRAATATLEEVFELIETRKLYSRGIGFVDATLLASCLLQGSLQLWTRDCRLAAVAAELGVDYAAGRPS